MAALPTRALTSRDKAAQAFPGSALRDNMLPPPEVEYASREKLEHAVQTFARGQGYAVTIKNSIAGKRVYLKCDRGGVNVPKVGEGRQRQSSSRRINCPFLLRGNFSKKRGNWKLNVLEGSHNHEPSLHPSGHSTRWKLTGKQADAVKNMGSRHDAMEANDEVEAINLEWNVLEKKFKELPSDKQKVLLAQVTQLLEGRSTVVELKAPKVHSKTRGRPPGSRNLPKRSTKRDSSKFEHVEKESHKKRK